MEIINLNSGWQALYNMNYPESIQSAGVKASVLNNTSTGVPVSPSAVLKTGSKGSGNLLLQIIFLVGIGWVIYEIINASFNRKQEREVSY